MGGLGTKLDWIVFFIDGIENQSDGVNEEMEKVLIEKLEKFGLESLQGNDVHGFIVEKLGIKELFEKFD